MGTIALLLQLVLSAALMVLIVISGLLPGIYTGLIGLGLAVLLAAAALGVFLPRERLVRLIIAVISFIVSAVIIIAGIYVKRTSDALSGIAGSSSETASISVYVFEDDEAQTIEDARDYDFGILASLDRDNTDKALEMIEEDTGSAVNTSEYNTVTDLADAMADGEMQSIILNQEYEDA